ncbi:MAG: hypothetical protein IT204_13370 [Fimbriimonadaceae bacterium]|nr:hypothetical protein [Fimbriimonadaceae bacterium]
MSLPCRLWLATLVASLAAAPGAAYCDPPSFGCLEEPAPELAFDALRGVLRPSRPAVPASAVWCWRAVGPRPALSLRWEAILRDPGDRVECLVSYDRQRWLTLAEQTWQRDPQAVVLDSFVATGEQTWVALRLTAAQRLGGLALRQVAWQSRSLSLVETGVAPPRRAWDYPVRAARAAQRLAPGLPPLVGLPQPGGRLSWPLAATWQQRGEIAELDRWTLPPAAAGRVRHLLLPGAAAGAALAWDEVWVAVQPRAGGPLGWSIPATALPGPLPPLALRGADPTMLRVVETGLLELRDSWLTTTVGGRAVEAVVVNHSAQDLPGQVRATLRRNGEPRQQSVGGQLFPPGAWLVRLPLEPGAGTLRLAVDLAGRVSDEALLTVSGS